MTTARQQHRTRAMALIGLAIGVAVLARASSSCFALIVLPGMAWSCWLLTDRNEP